MSTLSGNLAKMQCETHPSADGSALELAYFLPVGDAHLPLAPLIGAPLSLHYSGAIHCIACGRSTRKSYGQGYCFPCVQRLAECDLCIVSPEKCHHHLGTCRDPEWAEGHCMQGHYVYLSNTSGLKVGITRGTQIPTRWIDQGAVQGLPLFRVRNRYYSGLIEAALKAHVADRTDWRHMLKGDPAPLDLVAQREALLAAAEADLAPLREQLGEGMVPVTDAVETRLRYPVLRYPEKVSALNLDKQPELSGTLLGIKGQYLIFDCGVLNVRKYAGYQVRVNA